MKTFHFTPERLFITDQKLDFTLVAIEELSADGTKVTSLGSCHLFRNREKDWLVNTYPLFNILQEHPKL